MTAAALAPNAASTNPCVVEAASLSQIGLGGGSLKGLFQMPPSSHIRVRAFGGTQHLWYAPSTNMRSSAPSRCTPVAIRRPLRGSTATSHCDEYAPAAFLLGSPMIPSFREAGLRAIWPIASLCQTPQGSPHAACCAPPSMSVGLGRAAVSRGVNVALAGSLRWDSGVVHAGVVDILAAVSADVLVVEARGSAERGPSQAVDEPRPLDAPFAIVTRVVSNPLKHATGVARGQARHKRSPAISNPRPSVNSFELVQGRDEQQEAEGQFRGAGAACN